MSNNLTVSPAPHISKHRSTTGVMADVIIALIPAIIAACFFFRTKAAALIAACVITCCAAEMLCNLIRKKANSLPDLSAALTGIIIALSVPPQLPLWAAVIGSAFAIIIGKMVFGGLGSNIFNPAMVGRCFITACFGILMTTWTVPATIDNTMPQISAEQTDALTQATPLSWSKQAIKTRSLEDLGKVVKAAVVNNNLPRLFFGNIGGCLGETSALALIIGAIYLLIRKTITWHIPAAVLGSAFICASIGWLANPDAYITPAAHLCSGAMLLCAFYIATDPVTAPLTKKGMLIFGAGVGAITMLIRIIGEYPEGVMYAVVLMNAITPLIDRFTKLIPAGGKPNA